MKNNKEGGDIFAQFNHDIVKNGGYLYTEKSSYSSKIANKRLTEIALNFLELKNKKVIDVGCGDGVYTNILYKIGKPKLIIGIDAAGRAVDGAQKKYGRKNIFFKKEDCNKISFDNGKFDIAIARGLLHHLFDPRKTIKEMLRVADEVFIIEPNGYNIILKIIEKLSFYHRQHKEKSYCPSDLRKWTITLDGKIEIDGYFGLVPFFCNYGIARILKAIEPFIEKSFLKKVFCAVYVIKIKRQ